MRRDGAPLVTHPAPAARRPSRWRRAGRTSATRAGRMSARPQEPTGSAVVPHVVGHHIDQALRRLDDRGLRARVVTTEVHDKTDRHVVTTHPASGTTVEPGATVELVVGIAPAVDDYVGADLDDAVRLAEQRGHVVEVLPEVRSRAERTADHADGGAGRRVTAQEPEPGERSRVVILRHDGRPPPTS